MVVECPSCHTTYNFDDSVAQPGQKLRCTVCEHVFALPSGTDGAGDDADQPSADDAGAEVSSSQGQEGDAGGSYDFNLDSSPSGEKKGKGKTLLIALIAVVVLLGGGAGVAYYFAPQLLGGIVGSSSDNTTADGMPDPAKMQEMVKQISLESIRQYYVDNEKAGKIFVIEGRALNASDAPKELIEVEASLFDANNAVLDSSRQFCGNTLSLFQLQVLGQEEIATALTDEAGVGSNNVNLQPGQDVPFMFVFFSPSENVSEFVVKVAAVRDVEDL
ncbi:zinc-ribbon and DUF3426 domain-containing protein [Desulfobaculum senezii]